MKEQEIAARGSADGANASSVDANRRPSDIDLAVKDFREGILSLHVWPTLSWQEIRQRYRRSTLGPFWLTLSMGAMIGGMGPLYGRLLGQDVSSYLPLLAVGIVVWQLLAALINDGCNVFISAEQFIKQMKMPFFMHVMRMVARNAIVFAHNFVVVIIVFLFFPVQTQWWSVLALLGVLAALLNGIWIGALLGLLSARFRDIPQIVSSVVQIAFFLTPVMWTKNMLGRKQWVAELNPFFHYLDVIRAPLLGQLPSIYSWVFVLAFTTFGFAITALVFAKYRSRIAYWL